MVKRIAEHNVFDVNDELYGLYISLGFMHLMAKPSMINTHHMQAIPFEYDPYYRIHMCGDNNMECADALNEIISLKNRKVSELELIYSCVLIIKSNNDDFENYNVYQMSSSDNLQGMNVIYYIAKNIGDVMEYMKKYDNERLNVKNPERGHSILFQEMYSTVYFTKKLMDSIKIIQSEYSIKNK